jgi:hypothetical protein
MLGVRIILISDQHEIGERRRSELKNLTLFLVINYSSVKGVTLQILSLSYFVPN